MSRFLGWSATLGMAITVVAGVLYARPGWAGTVGLDGWNLMEAEESLREGILEQAELDERAGQLRERLAVESRIIDRLIAGRISLLQAAVEFRKVCPCPSSDGERLCLRIISWVAALSERTPAAESSRVEPLEYELRCLLQKDGVVHLPDQQ